MTEAVEFNNSVLGVKALKHNVEPESSNHIFIDRPTCESRLYQYRVFLGGNVIHPVPFG